MEILRCASIDLKRGPRKIKSLEHIDAATISLCVDGVYDGDYIMCPQHPNEVIFVFGTGFWELLGGGSGYGWNEFDFKAKCGEGLHAITVIIGSYGG